MTNSIIIKNVDLVKDSIVIDLKAKEIIESLASDFNLEAMKRFQYESGRLAENDPGSFTHEFRASYIKSLKGFLAWDLAFNARFDGNIQNWALIATGLLPKQYNTFKEFGVEIAEFAKHYINYYAAHVAAK